MDDSLADEREGARLLTQGGHSDQPNEYQIYQNILQ